MAALEELATNDLGRVRLRLAAPIAAAAYGPTSAGRAILIDETTNATVAAAMIRRPR